MAESQEILVFTTLADRDLAEEHIEEMLQLGIIISGTIFPEVSLLYQWEGKLTIDSENKILLKAKADKYSAIEEFIMKKHPYLAPEIIKMEASFGSDKFKAFIKEKIARGG
ncbi:divalent-cation tolerance protein CutA [Leptospira perolatii]|uniref:Divalent-cation tolerance protein CutA n=1 Tax=Leptospira perolatii TaxID=2023191 RepID=A0A2M9ZSQ2_9LEPT|nr:divalent cation tolerance protein CutA [Leptospira perolatii]PJZ68747.1 divalent-cation tolerance protein CutA [Leptospira perolatii]PJZ75102.1 divalent-cation tolerance protein CutA [Leptospira perolatii]